MNKVSASTRLLGVIGDPVAHSRSPVMHNAALHALGLDWCYVPLHVRPENLEAALRGLVALEFVGANVTIPHKERAAELVDECTPTAAAIGAVNTITVAGMRLLGDNTDAPGILMALAEAGVEISDQKAVVLGAGGSARAAAYALAQAGAQVTVANRTRSRAEELVATLGSLVQGSISALPLNDIAALQARLEEATLLVNTTPAGMEVGAQHAAPLPASPLPPAVHLPPGLAVLDLVYAPRQTPLLRTAAAAGCKTIEGLRVLVHQGALSLECWTGRPAPLAVMNQAVEA